MMHNKFNVEVGLLLARVFFGDREHSLVGVGRYGPWVRLIKHRGEYLGGHLKLRQVINFRVGVGFDTYNNLNVEVGQIEN